MSLNHTRRNAALLCSMAFLLASCDTGQEDPAPSAPAAAGSGEDTAKTGASSGSAAGGGQDGPVTLAYLQKQGDQQYFVDQARGAKEAAEELGDVTVNVVNLGTDSNKAISEVDAAIAQGVDGIIIVVPDQAIGPQVIDRANEAGIPIMASDDVIEDADGQAAPFTGFNGTAMGQEVGAEAARLYAEAGWSADTTRILSVYKQDLSVCKQRVDGALESFTEAAGGEAPEVVEVGTDNSVTDALNKTGAVFTANQDVENWIVWGCNDESETGAVTGLQNAGVSPDNIIGVGLGAYLTCKDWAAGEETGNKAALFIDGAEVGKAAVNAMVDSVRTGAELPPETIADTSMVDADTYEEAGVNCT